MWMTGTRSVTGTFSVGFTTVFGMKRGNPLARVLIPPTIYVTERRVECQGNRRDLTGSDITTSDDVFASRQQLLC